MHLLFRIDMERYLTHAIDHFTRDELNHFEYAIISAGIRNQGKCENMAKLSIIFPSMDIQTAFIDYNDKTIIRKMYFKELDEMKHDIYRSFINPILQHQDILIICTEHENVYIDILVEYLAKNFKLECIDLNELFIKGRIGSVYIDRDAIQNKAVDIRRSVGKVQIEALESTKDGRLKLLNLMGIKDKMKKLKDLGITVSKSDIKDLDKLLIESWVEDD
jgi:hypothetical protein